MNHPDLQKTIGIVQIGNVPFELKAGEGVPLAGVHVDISTGRLQFAPETNGVVIVHPNGTETRLRCHQKDAAVPRPSECPGIETIIHYNYLGNQITIYGLQV